MVGRRGSISIWYVIVLSGLVLLFGVSSLLLKQEKIENQLKRQSRLLTHNGLMTYNTSLFKEYGVLATTVEAVEGQIERDVMWLTQHEAIDGCSTLEQVTYSVSGGENLLTLQQSGRQMIEAARVQVGQEAIKLAGERLQAWGKGETSSKLLKRLQKGYKAMAAVEEWDRKLGKALNKLSKAELEVWYYTNYKGEVVIRDNFDAQIQDCEEFLDQVSKAKEILRPVRSFAKEFEADAQAVWDQLLPQVQEEVNGQLSTFKRAGHTVPLEKWEEEVRQWQNRVEALEDRVDNLRSYEGSRGRLKRKVRILAKRAGRTTLDARYDVQTPDRKAKKKAAQWMAVAPRQFENEGVDKLTEELIQALPSKESKETVAGTLTDSLLLTEYMVGTFRHARSHGDDRNGALDWDFFGKMERSSVFPNELEYIAVGGNPNTAAMRMQAEIYAMRSASNLIHVYTCKEKKTTATAIGALAAWTGIGTPVITNGVLVGWALAESGMDMHALNRGEGVPLYKWNDDQWRLDIDRSPNTQSPVEDKAQGEKDPLVWYYVDYLRLRLQLVSMEKRIARSLDVIWVNTGQPDLSTYIGKVQVTLEMTGPTGKELRAESELRYVAE